MNKKNLYLAVSLLMMTSCSSETDLDEVFTSPVPIKINVCLGDALTSRSTANDNDNHATYSGGETFAVSMTNTNSGLWNDWDVKKYKVSAKTESPSATLEPVNENDFFAWFRSQDSHGVVAWHLGYGNDCGTTAPTSYTVNTDQNTGTGALAKNDFLFAPVTTFKYVTKDENILTLYHQNAQLCIKLDFGGTNITASDITGITLSDVYLTGKWQIDYGTNIGSRYTGVSNPGDITLKKMNSTEYRAIIIPQDLAGKVLTFTLKSGKVDGNKLTYTFPSGNVLDTNQYATYELTVKEIVRFKQSEIIDWTVVNYGEDDIFDIELK